MWLLYKQAKLFTLWWLKVEPNFTSKVPLFSKDSDKDIHSFFSKGLNKLAEKVFSVIFKI